MRRPYPSLPVCPMKSWIFLAAVSVNVMVKAIPLLLLSRPALALLDELSPTPRHVHAQQITPSAPGAPPLSDLPATNTRSTSDASTVQPMFHPSGFASHNGTTSICGILKQ